MQPIRIIYEDAPDSIPVPEQLRHRKTEIILWPLEDQSVVKGVVLQRGTAVNASLAVRVASSPSSLTTMNTLPTSRTICREAVAGYAHVPVVHPSIPTA